jgi:adenylate kinase family enzyme
MIEAILNKHEKVVMSGAFVGWGNQFISRLNLVVYLHLPVEIRLERIMHREIKRFGNRVLYGGDLYQQHLDFLEWVKTYEYGDESTRSKKQHLEWMKQIPCQVIKIESVHSIDELIAIVQPYI